MRFGSMKRNQFSCQTLTFLASLCLCSLSESISITAAMSSSFQQIKTYQYSDKGKWQCFNSNDTINCCEFRHIYCLKAGPAVSYGVCATYSEDSSTTSESISIADCLYFQSLDSHLYYNTSQYKGENFVILPASLGDLNKYMCSPLNRKGIVCSKCVDGYGPSVTSDGYICVKCDGVWPGLLVYLAVELIPITVLYCVVLIFRISLTKPPMPCFILYAQLVVIGLSSNLHGSTSTKLVNEVLKKTDGSSTRLDMKISLAFYGIFNLQRDSISSLIPPLCISSRLHFIHVEFLGYISAFYPMCLICVTLCCVKLHDNNFRPLVVLWRPVHKCLHRQRVRDAKSDIIDVFITFLLLSYSKSMCVAINLLSSRTLRVGNSSGEMLTRLRSAVDLSIAYGSNAHIPFAIIAVATLFILSFIPPLILTLYPFKLFRWLLSKCQLDLIAIKIFADKIQSYYRTGLDGGKDMRSLSGLYFYLRMCILLVTVTTKSFNLLNNTWCSAGIMLLCTSLTVAIVRPYKKNSMNVIDALLLSNLAVQSFAMAVEEFRLVRILILAPMAIFILRITFLLLRRLLCQRTTNFKDNKCDKVSCCCIRRNQHRFDADTSLANTKATQPLLQPTSTEVSYDTCSTSE